MGGKPGCPDHGPLTRRRPEQALRSFQAIGDYVAGPNHVLPTGRRARFASGLSVLDFMKRTSLLGLDEAALAKLGPATVPLAHAKGLPAHARSVALRLRLNR